MEIDAAQLERLTVLGHGGRMAVFKALMARYPSRVPAGEVAQALDLKQNTCSVYLAALTRAGLIEQQRDGRRVLYRAAMPGIRSLIEYLLHDCCGGSPEACASLLDALGDERPENP